MTDTVDSDKHTDTTEIPPTPPPLRASDADRHAIVLILQDAVAAGLLTPEEGSDRIAEAYAATHLRDLPALVADLPGSQPAGPDRKDRKASKDRKGKDRRADTASRPGRTGRAGRAAEKIGRGGRAAYLPLLGALRRFLGTADGRSARRSRVAVVVVVGVLVIAALGFGVGTALFDGHGGGGGFDGHGV